MAVYSIREVAELINKPAKSVEVYVARKKLIKNENKKIDSNNPINAIFLAKYLKSETNEPLTEELTQDQAPETKDINNSASAMLKVEYAIKRLQAQKLQKEVEQRDIDLQKSKGELINLEKTVAIVSAYSKSIKNDMKINMQTFVQDICTQNNVDSVKIGKYKMQVTELINSCNNSAIEILLKEFGNE